MARKASLRPSSCWLAVVIAFASAGAAVKIVGSLYGSRAVLVDALTSIANLAALASILVTYKRSMMPADLDHPYGHTRLKYVGALLALLAYVFVAGAATVELYYSARGYTLSSESWKAALVGAAFYAAAIASSARIDPVLRVYAGFTTSELIESSISVASSFLGVELSYLVDLAGAAAIVAYIVYEAAKSAAMLSALISDRAPPPTLYQQIEREAQLRGLRLVGARLRMLDTNSYSGDILVEPMKPMPLDIASILAEELRIELQRKGVDVAVQLRPSRVRR